MDDIADCARVLLDHIGNNDAVGCYVRYIREVRQYALNAQPADDQEMASVVETMTKINADAERLS